MKYVQGFVTLLILVLALVSVELGFASTANAAKGEIPPPNITNEIPQNPDIAQQKANYPSLGRAVFLDNLAWQTFVALNWPANCQGKPLSNNKIGEALSAPRVWEFYRLPQEVFLANGQDPTTIQPMEPLSCLNDEYGSNQEQTLTARLTETDLLTGENEFDKIKVAASNSLLNQKGELRVTLAKVNAANQIPLVDQQGNYVINEIRINPSEFNQIVDNKWFDAPNLEQFNNSDRRFELVCSEDQYHNVLEVPCSGYSPHGAIEIKAAWRVFDERNSDEEKAHYYTTKRELSIAAQRSSTGKGFKQKVDLGLIGFHIVQKTSEQGWIWSTFEHVDNVPNDIHAEREYTLYNPNCQQNCEQNKPNVKTPYLWRENAPHAVTKIEGKIENQIPSQIVRLPVTISSLTDDTSKQVEELNRGWQDELKDISESSVWQYYKLIGTEWLTNPATPYNKDVRAITPTRPPLANVTLEPYIQKVSCIACHTSARLPNNSRADFSFLMDDLQSSNYKERLNQ